MGVKMLVGMAGPEFSLAPGDDYDCGDDEAARLIEAGFAEETAKKPVRKIKSDVVSADGDSGAGE